MTFKTDGFLSGDLHIFINQSHIDFKEWFELVADLNKTVFQALTTLHPLKNNKQQLTAALLFSRAVQSFQGAILLTERGMISEARTLVRNCAETAIVLSAVGKDASFILKLVESHQKHSSQVAKALSSNPDAAKELSIFTLASLQRVIDDVDAHFPNGKPNGYILKDVAKDVGLMGLYDTVFRGISGDAAHPTIGALTRHIYQDEAGKISDLRFEPVQEDLPHTLSMSISTLLHALMPISEVFKKPEFERIVVDFLPRWKLLQVQYEANQVK
ncbi:MAG: DUF5677 domain-containing protein [Collimonas sp.]|uniref:DUF5677 domain-containing protein n=1 Tax=Collimonas sp. TaxID=1963772 RepID=UPI003265BE20